MKRPLQDQQLSGLGTNMPPKTNNFQVWELKGLGKTNKPQGARKLGTRDQRACKKRFGARKASQQVTPATVAPDSNLDIHSSFTNYDIHSSFTNFYFHFNLHQSWFPFKLHQFVISVQALPIMISIQASPTFIFISIFTNPGFHSSFTNL
jgi:hypothetical protein